MCVFRGIGFSVSGLGCIVFGFVLGSEVHGTCGCEGT